MSTLILVVVISLGESILQAEILLEVLFAYFAFKAMDVEAGIAAAVAELSCTDVLQGLIEEHGASQMIACLETCNL